MADNNPDAAVVLPLAESSMTSSSALGDPRIRPFRRSRSPPRPRRGGNVASSSVASGSFLAAVPAQILHPPLFVGGVIAGDPDGAEQEQLVLDDMDDEEREILGLLARVQIGDELQESESLSVPPCRPPALQMRVCQGKTATDR